MTNAQHTAELVPGSRLVVVEGLGHLSIVGHALAALAELIPR